MCFCNGCRESFFEAADSQNINVPENARNLIELTSKVLPSVKSYLIKNGTPEQALQRTYKTYASQYNNVDALMKIATDCVIRIGKIANVKADNEKEISITEKSEQRNFPNPDNSSKIAKCNVSNSYGEAYRGSCKFTAYEKGSFTIEPSKRGDLILGSDMVSLWITEPGLGEVRGTTPEGGNSRWGEAERSSQNRACWVGSDFRICVN